MVVVPLRFLHEHSHVGLSKKMNAETFLNKYREDSFPHSERLIAALVSGDCNLQDSPNQDNQNLKPCRHYLKVWRFRIQGAAPRAVSAYAHSFIADCIALCEELAKTPDEEVRLWNFTLPPHFRFGVFEGACSNRIIGCLLFIEDEEDESELAQHWRKDSD